MPHLLDPRLLSVRDLSEADVPRILDYWYRSPPGFVESIGADPTKLPSETDMERMLRTKCSEARGGESRLNVLVTCYDNRPFGMHILNPLTEGDSAVFHAHFWDPAMRRRGVGVHTYAAACRVFAKRFNLSRILFKTPAQNVGAIRVKEKLGIRCVGQETIGFGIIKDGTVAKVFELTRAELEAEDFGATSVEASRLVPQFI